MSEGYKNLAPFLPDPEEKTTGLRPWKRLEGPYVLHREPGQDTILIVEPLDPEEPTQDGKPNTYELAFFEMEPYLKNILKIDEEKRNRILDLVWNFYHVAFAVDVEYVLPLRGKQPGEGEPDDIPHELLRKLGADPSVRPGEHDKDGILDRLANLVVDGDPKKKIKGIDRG